MIFARGQTSHAPPKTANSAVISRLSAGEGLTIISPCARHATDREPLFYLAPPSFPSHCHSTASSIVERCACRCWTLQSLRQRREVSTGNAPFAVNSASCQATAVPAFLTPSPSSLSVVRPQQQQRLPLCSNKNYLADLLRLRSLPVRSGNGSDGRLDRSIRAMLILYAVVWGYMGLYSVHTLTVSHSYLYCC